MSNSNYRYETSPTTKAHRDSRKPLKNSRSTSTIASPYYSNTNTHLNEPDWMSTSNDPQTNSPYVDMLTMSGGDWLDSYSYNDNNTLSLKTQRRTYTSTSQSDNKPVMARKSRSLRENSRYRQKSPPPPPKIRKSGFIEELPIQYKKKSLVQPKKSDESLSPITKNQPRKTVSSNIIHHRRSQNMTSALSDYQGYSRHSKHRSFTYSPPPPPRTSSLDPVDVPAVPPVPPMPKIHSASSSTKLKSLKKKKSDLSSSSSSRPTSSDISNCNTLDMPSIYEISSFQKELESIITDSKLATPSMTPSILNPSTKVATSDYALNLSNDLAQIEQAIKALELERDRHSLMTQKKQKKHEDVPVKTIGRKRGKTLPGSLATPPPIPVTALPPMTLNPIQVTIPDNIHKKRSSPTPIILQPSTSSTTTKSKFRLSLLSSLDNHVEKLFKHDSTETGMASLKQTGLGSGPSEQVNDKKLPLPNIKSTHRKSYATTLSQTQSTEKVRRATSFKQPKQVAEEGLNLKSNAENSCEMHHSRHNERSKSITPPESTPHGGRSPKSIQTTLKYYGPYLSDYERQIEIHDYQHIYFVGPHAKKHGDITSETFNFGFDDERGDYKIVIQDHLAYRYEVIEVLGRGSFGQVVKCFDHKTSQMVAIKLIRNKKRFHAQAITEVNILKKLISWDPEDHYNTIKMTDHFYFRNHLCIAFECLCMNLYEFIKSNHFQGFSIGLIRRITHQIVQSLLLLAEHDIIHCDLKPENIMLKHPGKSAIKVIDFGSSCYESERMYTYIQSRFYRSPEVILGISYHKAIDMWSLGCIIAELYTGIPIFPGENEQEQLSCIMEVMGIPDRHIIERCSRRKLFFDSIGNPRIVASSKGKKRIPGTKSLFQVLKCHDVVFIDFIERCLKWDPSRRMTPQEALQHEWITGNNSSSFHNTTKPITFLPSAAITSTYN